MQSGAQQGLQGGGTPGHGRNPPPPGPSSSSSSPSPSSSSSGVSAPHLGFDSIQQHQQFQQQQQQHQQQLAIRQSIQQQQLRKANGEDTLLPYQGGGVHGVMGGNSFSSSSTPMPLLQPARKFIDLSQQGPQNREENQNRGQSLDQHMQNQIHQAYLHYAYQASQQQKPHGNLQSLQQSKAGIILPSTKDQEIRMNNLKMQELMSMQASALTKSTEHFRHNEKQMEHGQTSGEQRSDLKPVQAMIGQLMTANMIRPSQAPPVQPTNKNVSNNQLAMMQLQALQAWAMENNIDLSLPANSNLISQFLPLWQSRMTANQKQNESSAATVQAQLPMSKQQIMPSPSIHDYPNANSENSAHAKSLTEVSGQVAPAKSRQTIHSGSFPNSGAAQLQQIAIQSRDNQVERTTTRHPSNNAIGVQAMHPPQNSASAGPSIDSVKSTFSAPEPLQMQYFRQLQQLNRPPSQPAVSSSEGLAGHFPSQGASSNPVPQQRMGFTKQQLHVLKAQILAFRRLKRGEGSLPQEVLRAIAPPTLNTQHVYSSPGTLHQDRMATRNVEHARSLETNDKGQQIVPMSKGQSLIKEEMPSGEEKPPIAVRAQGLAAAIKEPTQIGSDGKEAQSSGVIIKSEPEMERGSQSVVPAKSDFIAERGKTIQPQGPTPDTLHVKKPSITTTGPPLRDPASMRKYNGPLFDFPFFTNRKFDSFGSSAIPNSTVSLAIGYDVKDLLFEEGMDVLNKKRTENLKKIGRLLAVNLDRKRISPDLVLRLQIEERKLRLLDLQARIRDEVDQQQQEIMAMPDRPYRKFVRLCERQRVELARQVQLSQKIMREKQLKFVFQWRKKLLEAHWAIRDARTARNRGVAKYHERMLREFSKRKDDDRNRRMEALKNNDVDRYREMLLEQQTNMPGDAAQRYAVLSSFLSQTEDYLHKLGGKITAVKNNQEVEEAAFAAAAAARAQGLSEEEVKTAAACAGEEVMIRNRFSEMNAPKGNSSVNKYYHLAHAVSERVVRQPSMLRAGTLRDYQLVGLQWMLSLYNNKLNGILADEMGLGKTVQVMALIAYLMEFKGNYGPHLIIVPNAVLVNWKSELHTWLPSVSCIYYVGGKDQRNKLYSQEVCAMKFNALVTTYEFVMNDKAKLAKVDWKYIIIDEAQRMKDRDSVLARDLDRYRCQRRLLLTGTPLQNDLKELWSLLNLLLPEVFDNCKAFNDWFSKPFQKDASSQSAEDDWLETEKKVIIIHRLHQILEPFMLRRRVEDVEGSLPRKDSIVLRCRMSAVQGSIYDWIKATGCLRLDPEDEIQRVQLNPNRQIRAFKTLQNRCMELRKVCNHPLLTYPYLNYFSDDFIVRCCGKLWILDRILVKLHRTGHRVLLFSTMTKLLDILEEYLQWRRLVYRRIDGGTSLEDRESAIVDFNSPDTEIFIFLLSIRAAGRGLNLQTADTVVIYDPDANPKNEEQAVARAHRIGQKRDVKVIYMEAVVDKISSYQKEDELRIGGMVDSEDDLAGKDRYMGSIESLIRNNIQQYKIDMADEVINAGRFDQRTTQEERRMTLETLLHDEERYQENIHDVPSLQEVNRMIARCEEEVELFDRMDEELDWPGEMRYDEIPKWLRAGSREVDAYIAQAAKKSSKSGLGGAFGMEVDEENFSNLSPSKTGRRRGRPRGSSKKYSELDDQINYDENGEDFDESSEERNAYASEDEEEEIREFEGEDFSRAACAPPKDQLEGEGQTGGYEIFKRLEGVRGKHILEEVVSSGSSSDSRRLTQIMTPTISSQKFGSLSALDARPGSIPKRMPEELEEGEIAVSGDSHMDLQQSGSWIHDRDDGEDEQVLQPTIRRKRSIRLRPRSTSERIEEKSSSENLFLQHRNPLQLPTQPPNGYEAQLRTDPEHGAFKEPGIQMHGFPTRRGANSSKQHIVPKPSRLNSFSRPAEDTAEFSREDWDDKAMHSARPVTGKMSDGIERKLKNVLSKLQKMIDKNGHKLAPILTDFWKRNENSSYTRGLDFRKIEQSVDRLDYNGMMDFVSDVQLMLKTCVQYCGFSYEVRSDARKLQALFFDLMKAAFPDTDFREVRRLVSFSGPGTTAYPSPKQVTQSKRHKPTDEMEPELGPARLLPRGPVHIPEDFTPLRGAQTSKLQKEARVVSSGREAGHSDEVVLLTHPGDLIICKKRRKDRDKSSLKTSSVDTCRNGRDAVPKETKQIQQQLRQAAGWALAHGVGTSGVEEVQWAKPVKRMRTDTGKRRPSHL